MKIEKRERERERERERNVLAKLMARKKYSYIP